MDEYSGWMPRLKKKERMNAWMDEQIIKKERIDGWMDRQMDEQ